MDLTNMGRLQPIAYGTVVETGDALTYSLLLDKNSSEPVLEIDRMPEASRFLSAVDRRLVDAFSAGRNSGFESLKGWGDAERRSLKLRRYPELIETLRACNRVTAPNGQTLQWSDDLVSVRLELTDSDDGKSIIPTIHFTAGEEVVANPVFLSDRYVLDGHTVRPVAPVGPNYEHIGELIGVFSRSQLETYLSLFLSYFDNILPCYRGKDATFTHAVEKSVATIILEKVAPDQALYLRVTHTLESSSEEESSGIMLTRAVSISDEGRILVRNIENTPLEEKADLLETMILKSAPGRQARKDVFRDGFFFIIPAETASPFLLGSLPEILANFRLLGSEKLKEYKVTAAFPKLNVKLSSGIDFLEGDANVEIEGETFTLSDLLAQFRKRRYIQLSDGNRAIMDEKYMGRLQRLFNNRDKDGRVRVSFFDLPEVEEMIQKRVSGKFATHARKVYEGFNKLKGKKPKNVDVRAELRPYQRDGVTWLEYLADNNLGGCLADDMGLGKTLQAISLLTTLHPGAGEPSIVVMPRSLLFNWENELSKFAPQLSVSTYYGPDRNLEECLQSDVMLTTYAVARNDIEQLREYKFTCAILDESQNIKNAQSQTARAVTLLNADHRFALSGTPMENNLTEIYSLFRFLNPTMFGTLDSFNSLYTYPIQRDGDAAAMQALRRRIYPFMLRRVKKDVLTELPDRVEQTIYVEMSESQKRLYETRRLAYKQEIEGEIAEKGIARAQFVMFQALSELRRIASVPESMSDGKIASPKIDELLESLSAAVQNGHKCVVFFNYIAGLELVGARLDGIGVQFESMTGSTSAAARKRIVNRFQTDPECKVLLMTLKVGGVGLNLTAADTVYIFEPWWNKAAEEQAINRLHRIGQKATVNAYSIITVGTIEEKIRLLQEKKAELFDRLISADTASSKQLSKEDIDFILS